MQVPSTPEESQIELEIVASAGAVSQSKAVRKPLSRQLLADLALLFVTLIWGGTFVMVKEAVTGYPVFSFLTIRFGIAVLALTPLVMLRKPIRSRHPAGAAPSQTWLASLLIGAALFAGYGFQTAGLQLTSPARAAFITGLAVVIVPLLGALLLRENPGRGAIIGVGSALIGLALLTLNGDLSVALGDLLVLGCALAFAGHILLASHYAPQTDPFRLAWGQFVVVTALSGLAAMLWEPRGVAITGPVVFAAIFTGLLATALAFAVQMMAQRFTSATHTALIFAAEPVFGALFSLLLIGERLGPQQLAGCILILAGMLAAELWNGTGAS